MPRRALSPPRDVWARPAVQIALAIAGVAALTLARYPLEPFLQGRAPYALYYVPVLVAAWRSASAAVVAVVLSAAAGWFLVSPHDPAGRAASMALFLLSSGGLVLLVRAARRKRYREDEALAASRRVHRAADVAAWESDPSGAIVWSEGLARLFGDDPGDEALARVRFESWIHSDDWERYQRQLQRACDGGTQLRAEFRVENPRRAPRWVASIGEAARDASGRPMGMAGVFIDVTERKRAEETRAYLASIVESCGDAIVAVDLEGVIQAANPEAERLFGYRAAELVGRPVTTLIPRDRQADEALGLERLRQGERVDPFETVRLARDGRSIDVSLTMSPIRTAAGELVGASAVIRDVTEQRQAAEARDTQRDWFRAALASVGDAVIAADVDGRVVFMNAVAERLTGWTAAEAAERPAREVVGIVAEKTGQPIENPLQRVLRSRQAQALEVRSALVGRDGTLRPIADSAAPILDDRGRVLGAVLVFHDVSEQRRIEETLGEQREWLETTLESIGDAVIATDVGGAVVFMNPVAERLTGWRAAEARGRACDEVFRVIDEKTRLPAPNPVRRAVSEVSPGGLSGHGVLVAADGAEHPIDDSSSPIRNRAGRVVGAVLVFRDVSERRRAEAERQAAAADRDRLLESERTARAEAERANRLKDDFVAMVSHELRTPLNAILGWTRLLLDNTGDPDKLRHGLEVVERNTVLQAQLISDLLDMSRIVSGKLRLEVEAVDLASVVEDAIHTVQPAAQARGVAIRRDLAALDTAYGDPARLQQAVSNLLSNAVKFTPGGGTVTVTLRRSDPYAEITVADDGMGIQPDALPFVFERFRQGEAPTTRRHGGLGLGLAIVKQIVELHGGSVRAESPGEGAGSRFTVTIPLAAARSEERAPAPEQQPGGLPDASLESVKVLVVEDEPDTRDLIERLLREKRADVLTAATAGEALEVLGEKRPDILVSDIGLPDVDGYELMQRIRRLDPVEGGGIPAVALTAFARSEDRTRALRAGYQAHLAKPVEPAELVAAVARYADVPEARRRARSSS